jgi:hypothetical protein
VIVCVIVCAGALVVFTGGSLCLVLVCSVPFCRFWIVKVKALAQSRNWPELEKFSKSKKSPIGYEPFADECLAMSNRPEAKKYIERIPLELRVPYYIRIT